MKKTILITGASSGIGKATALQLIKDGHTVYGAARRTDRMQDLVEAGGHALAIDVTDEKQTEEGINQILKEQGRIDVLINNAGVGGGIGALETLDEPGWRWAIDVNLMGVVHGIHHFVTHMLAQGEPGHIVNTASDLMHLRGCNHLPLPELRRELRSLEEGDRVDVVCRLRPGGEQAARSITRSFAPFIPAE